MFESVLKESLEQIFGLKKSSYDLPGEDQEQECMFIQIETARINISDKKQDARVTGTLRVFANLDKLPYGFFMKAVAKAKPNLTKPFYFYNFEENAGTYKNICERTLDFVYFFDSQYDPAVGRIENITIEQVTE